MAKSSRRAEGHPYQQRPQHKFQRRLTVDQTTATNNASKHAQMVATQIKTRNSTNYLLNQNNPALARMKRPLDSKDSNHYDPHKSKRARIAVEILARPRPLPPSIISPSKSVVTKSRLPTRPQPTTTTVVERRPSSLEIPSPPSNIPLRGEPLCETPTAGIDPTTTPSTEAEHGLKKHQEKAISSIRHELDRLQPASDTKFAKQQSQTSRKLRSQEATRFKSELSAYFPDYDEVIGNDPKEQHILNLDTPIAITDHDTFLDSSNNAKSADLGLSSEPHLSTVRTYSDKLFTDLHDAERLNFTSLDSSHNEDHERDDPLPDALFEPAHKKAERLEKSIRNTEKGRAQHEKDQIIRLLGELQGHDWLRTMGVSGVTESRKKTFEPARDHFIKGCQAILEKFRAWSQEEKRRKLEKERALAEAAAGEEDEEEEDEDHEEDEEDEGEESEEDDGIHENQDTGDVDAENSANESSDDELALGHSDVDASARQLHAEALVRAKYAASGSPRRRRGEPRSRIPEIPMLREFTSFFDKKHQRDAALSKDRRRGRTVFAWGHPVPDMMEYDFDLPDEYRDEEMLKARERQKRRERRRRNP